jgi:hypothetical protein
VRSLTEPRLSVVHLGREVTDALALSGAKATPSRIVLVVHAPRVAGLEGGRVPGWDWQSTTEVLKRHVDNALVLVRKDEKATIPERVAIASQGDQLQLARIVLEIPKGFVHVHPAGAPAERAAGPVAAEPQARVFDHAEYQRVMQRVLAALPPSAFTRAREFFHALDRHTEPDLVKSNPFPTPTAVEGKRVLAAAQFVRRGLDVRMSARMREHRATPFRSTPFADPLSFRPSVQRVSDVFLRLLWQHFPDGRGGLDLAAVEEAFELFATGELRLRLDELDVWTTEPSSGAFFLFGEFALLATECDVEPALWTRLANVMVRAQELFCRTYPVGAARPRLADYSVAAHAPDGRPSPSERAALRALYAGLTHEELSLAAMRNLERYAPGELDPAVPTSASAPSAAPAPADGAPRRASREGDGRSVVIQPTSARTQSKEKRGAKR